METNIIFLANGRINMDFNSYFKVARFLAPIVAEKLELDKKRLEPAGSREEGSPLWLGSVAEMDTFTGEVKTKKPRKKVVGSFDQDVGDGPAHLFSERFKKRAEEVFGRDVLMTDFCERVQFHKKPTWQYSPIEYIGEYVKKTRQFILFERVVETGFEDYRTYRQRKKDMMNGWVGDRQLLKSRAGFSLGQNYMGSQKFTVCASCFPKKGDSLKAINNRFYEAWLGHIGQLDKYPYEGHEMAPKKLLKKLEGCRTRDEIAMFVREHWQEMFKEDEIGSIYSRLNL